MSTLRKFLLILPLALIFSAIGSAQTAAFEGVVKGPDGKVLQGAVVKTDKKGHYFYGGLPLGNYRIIVAVDGTDRDNKPERASPGETKVVDFSLAAAGEPAKVDESGRALSAADKAELEKKNKEQAAAMAKNKELNDAFNAGKTAAAANNWDGAVDGFTKASAVDPNQHVVWGNLADSYVSRAKAAPATREADLGKAADAYQKAIALKADDSAYHNNYALVLAQEKKFDDAQTELTKAAQLDPPNAGKYYYNLGAVYVNTGNGEAASAAFKKALELDPNYADAYYQYGLSLMGKATTDPTGKIVAPPGTTEAFQKYLELKPDGPFAQPSKDMLASMGSKVETNFKATGKKK
jgi:tetratricopeptide (TPR) repeat protein